MKLCTHSNPANISKIVPHAWIFYSHCKLDQIIRYQGGSSHWLGGWLPTYLFIWDITESLGGMEYEIYDVGLDEFQGSSFAIASRVFLSCFSQLTMIGYLS